MVHTSADINSDDYYKVLGVERTASDAEINKAYKKLALQHHPDRNPENKEQAEQNFKKLGEAVEVLRDTQKRKEYDQFGKAGLGDGSGADHCSGMPRGTAMSREQADKVFNMYFNGNGNDPFSGVFVNGKRMSGTTGGMGFSSLFSDMGHQRDRSRSGGRDPFDGFGFASDGMGFGGAFPTMGGRRKDIGFGRRGAGGPRSPGARGGDRAPHYVMRNGTGVIVGGLNNASHHNGKIGRIAAWDEQRGRYEVALDDCKVALKADNLTQTCKVETIGLESKPQLNGKAAEICSFDASKGRYVVLIEDADMVSLQPGNCILPVGTCIVVFGLSNAAFNDQMAQIVAIDRAAKRYTVKCQSGEQIKIKYENALC
mmetsp:Transcript_128849/g.223462  ORF Transcript_128849/g.223462 Transcript_128849/m.223462 type:complete len:370 (-) Transcript_128849:112-1221(-)